MDLRHCAFLRVLVTGLAVSVLSISPLSASQAATAEGSAGPPPVDELAAALHHVQLVGGPLPKEAGSYSVGHLRLDFGGGSVYAVTAAGIPVGVFFRGDGTFTYRSENVFERDLFPLNVDRVTRLEVKDGAVSDSFDTALVLDPAIAQRLPGFAISPEHAPEEASKALANHLERFENDRLEIGTLVAQAMADGAGDAVAAVRIESGRDDLVYVHDGLTEGEENLFAMKRFPSGTVLSGVRYAESLSTQPLGDPLERWPVRFVLTNVDLELVNPGERAMTLDIRETFAVKLPLETLELELWNERITGDGLFPYTVQKVTDADGKPLHHVHRKDRMVVELPKPAAPGDEVELHFRIAGDVLNRPGGHSFWWLPIGNWMPRPPRLDMASFTYHAVVKAAKPFIPFSMGHEVRRWEEGDLQCVETRLDEPIQFAVILAGKYHTYSEERDGFRITLASYAFSHDESMRKIANNMFQIKKLYEVLLGEFPFGELHIIEINQYGFGIAPPGVIYLTREAFDPSPQGRVFRQELNLRMAHELAHMYWGHVAQMSSFEDQWLSESTAEYYGALAVGQFLGKKELKQAQRAWNEQKALVTDAPSIYLANRIAGEKAGRERYGLLYARGPLMLQELHQELGDQVFFTVMKSFLTNFRFQHVKTEKFLELTNFITKKDYRPWFEERLFGLE